MSGKSINLGKEASRLLKDNIRQYVMYIALVVIFTLFTIMTNGTFITGSNISNLIKQSGYVAILAIGMTLVLIIVNIDLSVGYVAGFTGAIAAALMSKIVWPGIQLNSWLAIIVVLFIGLLIGLYQGFLIAYLKIPAFVTTLAGMFIFRGLLSLTTEKSGTIIVTDETFNKIGNGFIAKDYPIVTYIIGILITISIIISQVIKRKDKIKYKFDVCSMPIFILGMLLATSIVMGISDVLAKNNGIPWVAVIVTVVFLIYNYILNRTALGRYIYGIGGNAQAAELSGVNVRRVMLFCFCSMSVLAALAGVVYTSRIQAATPTAGLAFEMDAIASAYIGGVAVSGGVGKLPNTLVGALVIMSLTNGMNLMGIGISYQYIVKGVIFIVAVAFDVMNKKK